MALTHLVSITLVAAGCILVLALAGGLVGLVRVAMGLTSHTLCSAVFVSRVDPGLIFQQTVAPIRGMGLVRWALRYAVDTDGQEVRVDLLGAFESRTVFRPPFGCLLVRGPAPGSPPKLSAAAPAPASPAVPMRRGPARLETALDRVFAARGPVPGWAHGVVIAHEGAVLAERYAPGFGPDTRLHGWSVTKAAVNALIGILVRQGRIRLEEPAAVPEWHGAGDPRRAITVGHLLQMRSGLAFAETHSGFDPVSRMLYRERDMAGYVARARVRAAPGSAFMYTSGNTLILSRLIRDLAGGDADAVLRFARTELFAPAGMDSAVLEFDATGTPVGSTYLFATARDWARFGLLYLNDGVASGRRILPEGWARYSSTPTAGTNYAAGFWTPLPRWGLPADAFLARGYLGQAIVIIPSARLVVARFGAHHGAGGDMEGVAGLVAEALRAVGRPGGSEP